jgi:para-aminobenzoate synthetase component I
VRTSKEFHLKNPQLIKAALLNWSRQFNEVAWLDSNDYEQHHRTYDAILAVEAFTALKTDFHGAFEKLGEYQTVTKDWLFGYLSYDLKNDVEDLSSNNFDGLLFPDLYFFQPQKLFFLKGNKLEAHYLRMVDDEMDRDLEEILKVEESGERKEDRGAWTEDRAEGPLSSNLKPETRNLKPGTPNLKPETPNQKPEPSNPEAKTTIQPVPRISKDQYIDKVGEMLRHIQRGDIYEANFCQEFFAEGVVIDPVRVFTKLNEISLPPFAVFLKLENYFLLSASPERYLKKSGEKILSQPIKGTARRSREHEEDRNIATSLANDAKERSENIMIVDLVRNDLSRIARKGSVKVDELCKVYTFKQVHQMISTISAELESGISPVEVLRSTFPMGSMTGAPKISAMKIIEELEKTKRGLYSGAVGYFSPEGDFDFNVVIRSILYNSENKYTSFSVGGAITAGSVPEKEYEECLLKAEAMRQALNLH